MYLLDTNIVSGLLLQQEKLVRRLELADGPTFVNGIVVEEIAFKGFSSQINDIFGNKSKADVGRVYQSMIDAMLALTAFPLIPYTVEAEGRYRSLKSVLGSRLKKMDGRIAAHALHLDYVLVTQNIRDFQHIPGI